MLPNFRKVDVDAAKNTTSSSATMLHIASSNHSLGSSHRFPDRGIPSIIGQSLQITGNLISQGEVQVEGEIKGDIYGSHVIIGENAHIQGTIIAEEVVVRGNVLGTVRGKRVLLQPTARVDGDIYHCTIAIEQGAYFEGKSRRVDNPTEDFEDELEEEFSTEPPLRAPRASSLVDNLQHAVPRNSLHHGERTPLGEAAQEPETTT